MMNYCKVSISMKLLIQNKNKNNQTYIGYNKIKKKKKNNYILKKKEKNSKEKINIKDKKSLEVSLKITKKL